MGNKSFSSAPKGVERISVLLPGYFVEATILIPTSHPHALWWLAYLTRLLRGATLAELERTPPWPVPADGILARQLIRELIDQRWVIPDWTRGGFALAPGLEAVYRKQGDFGLARELFRADAIPGEWWMDGLGGTILSRQTALQFDYDLRPLRPDVIQLEPFAEPQSLLEGAGLDLQELLRKLGRTQSLRSGAADRAYLGSLLEISGRKDLLFQMYGNEQRLLPDELADLEPALWEQAPQLFGQKAPRRSNVLSWKRSVVEQFATLLEKFPALPIALDAQSPYPALIRRLKDLLERADDWVAWVKDSHVVVPVVGETDLQFGALLEMCNGTFSPLVTAHPRVPSPPNRVLLISSFLNEGNLDPDVGLLAAFQEAPATTQFFILYGHATDDLPEKQQMDAQHYLERLYVLAPTLTGRVDIVTTRKRSHEKVVLTDRGDWLLGSCNLTSASPGATLFECSLAGKSDTFCLKLLERIAPLADDDLTSAFLGELKRELKHELTNGLKPDLGQGRTATASSDAVAHAHLERLRRAMGLLEHAVATACSGPVTPESYSAAINAVRGALSPFVTRTRLELVQEHQSRDIFVTQVQSSIQDLLMASDRVTDSALDRTLLRDVKGNRRQRPILRLLWGREWKGRKTLSADSRDQLTRARRALREATDTLGDRLKTSPEPMENHAKLLIVDACRGLVTSENLLSYGGEKDRYESRELGIFFESLPVARIILGRAVMHALEHFHLDESQSEHAGRPYEWLVAALDAWYAFDTIRSSLDWDFRQTRYLRHVVMEGLDTGDADTRDADNEDVDEEHENPTQDKSGGIERGNHSPRAYIQRRAKRVGGDFFAWLREEGIRSYLLNPSEADLWIPYNQLIPKEDIERFLARGTPSTPLVAAPPRLLGSPKRPNPGPPTMAPTTTLPPPRSKDPLIEQLLKDMVEIPPGTFRMGSDHVHEERPRHTVVLSRPFWMSRYVVTQEIWEKVMNDLPHLRDSERHPRFPIIHVDFRDIQAFLKRLNGFRGGGGFELPTEAQWEYACRAGSESDYCFGSDTALLNQYAWSKENSQNRLHEVGLLKPNAWGLHDMHGLVYESVRDDRRQFSRESVTDPMGPLNSGNVGARGGAWGRSPIRRDGNRAEEHFRCASRQWHPKTEKSHRASFRLIYLP